MPQTFAQNATALSGSVSSAKEGAMEGVVASARSDGSTITVSVISDDKGHFQFPASRLDPGYYAISIRASGYDRDGPKDVIITEYDLPNRLIKPHVVSDCGGSNSCQAFRFERSRKTPVKPFVKKFAAW